jgi:IS1 family transposase
LQGILAWTVGDRSAKTFEQLWAIVAARQSYFYITDGWTVYPSFIPDGDPDHQKVFESVKGY